MILQNGWNIRMEKIAGNILGRGSVNKRRGYYVTPSIIGHAYTQNAPWIGWITTTARSVCHKLLTLWATSASYTHSFSIPVLLSNGRNQPERLHQSLRCALSITAEWIFNSIANRCAPIYDLYIVVTVHLAICKIATVTAGCHRIPIPITGRAKSLWGS